MYCAESEKPVYVMYGSIYMTFWKRQNNRNREEISYYQELRVGQGGKYKGIQGNWRKQGWYRTVLYPECGGDTDKDSLFNSTSQAPESFLK